MKALEEIFLLHDFVVFLCQIVIFTNSISKVLDFQIPSLRALCFLNQNLVTPYLVLLQIFSSHVELGSNNIISQTQLGNRIVVLFGILSFQIPQDFLSVLDQFTNCCCSGMVVFILLDVPHSEMNLNCHYCGLNFWRCGVARFPL